MAELSKQPFEVARLDCTGTVGSNRKRASWNDSQRKFLLQQLPNFPRAQKGRWTKDTWGIVAQAMKEAFPDSKFTTQQLKQLEQDLHRLYNQVREILMRPGFKWDDKNCKLHASIDCWQQFIESNGKLSWFSRRIPYYTALVVLYKGPDVEAKVETKSTTMQIGATEDTADKTCTNFDGFCANLSPLDDEIEVPSSPDFWGSDRFRLNNSHVHDIDNMSSSSIPLSPLFNLDPNPQDKYNYNTTAHYNPSEISHQIFQTKTYEEAGEFSHHLASFASDGMTTQSNRMQHNFPAQASNFQPSSHLDPDQPLCIPDHFSNSQQLIPTTTSDKPAMFPGSKELVNNLHSNSTTQQNPMFVNLQVQPVNVHSFTPLSPNIPPCGVPYLNNCENKSLSSNDSDMGRDLTLSSTLRPDRASNSQQPEKQESFFSKENPTRNVRQKSDLSATRCISIFENLPGFAKYEIIPVVEIFKKEFNREVFIAMNESHQKIWIRSMIDKANDRK